MAVGTLVDSRQQKQPPIYLDMKALSICSSTGPEETGRHLGSVVCECVRTAVGQERKPQHTRELSIYAGNHLHDPFLAGTAFPVEWRDKEASISPLAPAI